MLYNSGVSSRSILIGVMLRLTAIDLRNKNKSELPFLVHKQDTQAETSLFQMPACALDYFEYPFCLEYQHPAPLPLSVSYSSQGVDNYFNLEAELRYLELTQD